MSIFKRCIDSFKPVEEDAKGLEMHANGEHEETQLKRNLSGRHLQMIAIGGSIGTGLFVGSGKIPIHILTFFYTTTAHV